MRELTNSAAMPTPFPYHDINVDFPYEVFTLDNGLTVIVHQNHQAPLVAVNLCYRVGAKDEVAGKTGLAHLFEHLMFGGSKHLPGSYVEHMLKAGALDVNGATSRDRTIYYQTVPVSALDFALFAESDRMGHFLETLDQSLLDRQRGVVLNEKMQSESAPYGRMTERVVRATYPYGHPYAHTVFGAAVDLENVTLDDARHWFQTYYTPSNAVLTLAGDISVAEARRKAELYFGHIPCGEPLSRPAVSVCLIDNLKRECLEDRIPQGCVSLVWNAPPYGERQTVELMLVMYLLSHGISSFLHRKLVLEAQIASQVEAHLEAGMLGSQFMISALVRPGYTLEQLERAINDILRHLVEQGIEQADLERVSAMFLSGFIKRHETVTAIADLLSHHYAVLGEASGYRAILAAVGQATPASIRQTMRQWLSEGRYVLHVAPFVATSAGGKAPARVVPPLTLPTALRFPALQHARLENGMRVVLVERRQQPVTTLSLIIPRGAAGDGAAEKGLTPLLCHLMNESAVADQDAAGFTSSVERIGARIGVGMDFDRTRITLNTLTATLPQTLEKFAARILSSQFSEQDFERCRALHRDGIADRLASSEGVVHHLLSRVMFPDGHPYAKPGYGGGTAQTLSALSFSQAIQRQETLINPTGATLLAVGSTTLETLLPQLNRRFGAWRSAAIADVDPIAAAPSPGARAFLFDKPDSAQTTIAVASLIPQLAGRDDAAFSLLHDIMVNGFRSRLNMRLREELNWTYGVGGLLVSLQGVSIHGLTVSVQAESSVGTIEEIQREYQGIVSERPVTEAELEDFRRSELLRLSGGNEGVEQLTAQVRYLVERGLPDDYWQQYAGDIAAVTQHDLHALAQRIIQSHNLTWIVVGDMARIGDSIRALLPEDCRMVDASTADQ